MAALTAQIKEQGLDKLKFLPSFVAVETAEKVQPLTYSLTESYNINENYEFLAKDIARAKADNNKGVLPVLMAHAALLEYVFDLKREFIKDKYLYLRSEDSLPIFLTSSNNLLPFRSNLKDELRKLPIHTLLNVILVNGIPYVPTLTDTVIPTSLERQPMIHVKLESFLKLVDNNHLILPYEMAKFIQKAVQ